MTIFIGVISNSVIYTIHYIQVGLIADIVYNYFLQKTRPNFLIHCRKITIDVIKICFPRCFSCKKSKTAYAINATPPQIQPPNVSGYANTPYSRSSHSWHDGCLHEGYPDLFSSAHLPPRLSSKHNPP